MVSGISGLGLALGNSECADPSASPRKSLQEEGGVLSTGAEVRDPHLWDRSGRYSVVVKSSGF